MDDFVVMALFRHGITEANKRHAYLGWTDSPLCGKAKKTTEQYDYLFSSDLGRCLETAKNMFPNQKKHCLPEFRELNFGQWEGKTFAELENDPVYQAWLANPFMVKPPEGEAFADFTNRVDAGMEKVIRLMIRESINRAAIVTHGGVIRDLLTKWAPEEKPFWEWEARHDKGYELVWNRDELRRGKRCTLLREVPLMAKQSG